jgi:hypothetical protein
MRHYHYVGSRDLLESLPENSGRFSPKSAESINQWIIETKQPREMDGSVVLTFIIALDGKLWLNERRSEHVLCAAKQDVLSAGEITFAMDKTGLQRVEVTNQSTGYCPEPESWPAVASALDELSIQHPDGFTTAYIFRRCEECQSTNLVKDNWFYCAVCDAPLPQEWNFA